MMLIALLALPFDDDLLFNVSDCFSNTSGVGRTDDGYFISDVGVVDINVITRGGVGLLLKCLEAFPVDDAGAGLVVLLLGDPHLLEGGQGGEDGAADPHGVLSLRRSDDLDLNGGWSQSSDFLLHPVSNTRVHCGTSGQDGVGVQVLPDVHVALHDRVVHGLVDSARLHSEERGLEEGLWAPETLVSDGDDLTIGKLIGLLEGS